MNDWYIDRSKNFVNPSLEPVLFFLNDYEGDRTSNNVIEELVKRKIFDETVGNPYAALTRFRDHGLISNRNIIGDSAKDYIEGLINIDELIVDLFLKRPALKKQSPDLKPFVLLSKFFYMMFEIVPDPDDIYLSYLECQSYLYKCNSLDDLSYELVDAILNNRLSTNVTSNRLKQNEITNLSIWFNALRQTPFFISLDERDIIKPNFYQRDFFEYIALNARKFQATPTEANGQLYEYYCNRSFGINEIIPDVFKENVVIRDDSEVEILIDYLFGYKKAVDYDFSYYFNRECFGVYNAFRTIPGLIYRKIYIGNKPLGKAFIDKRTQEKACRIL